MTRENITKAVEFFGNKNALRQLFLTASLPEDNNINGKNTVHTLIGNDINIEEFDNFSFISTSYKIGSETGDIGIFGSIKMDYEKVISMLNYTSKILSFAIDDVLKKK